MPSSPFLALIRHLFHESLCGLNPFAEEGKRESSITLFVTLGVLGMMTSYGTLMPFFFGVPHLMALKSFWLAQGELILKFMAMIGIFSVLRWDPFWQGIERHRFFLSIISAKSLLLASQTAQFLFVLLLTASLSLPGDLLFAMFIPKKLGIGILFFTSVYLFMYTTLAIMVFFLIQSLIIVLQALHLQWLRYLLLAYLTLVIIIPASLIRALSANRHIDLIPYYKTFENMLKNMLAGNWHEYGSVAAVALGFIIIFTALTGLYLQHKAINPAGRCHRLRSRLAIFTSGLQTREKSPLRGVALHLWQAMLANRQLRTVIFILMAVLLGAFNAAILEQYFWSEGDLVEGIRQIVSIYYFVMLMGLNTGLYYILKLPLARPQVWLFQLVEPHTLFWSNKKFLLRWLSLLGLGVVVCFSLLLALVMDTKMAVSHALIGLSIWIIGAGWHSWTTDYIPFTAQIERDRLKFKRLWLLYVIGLYALANMLSALALSLQDWTSLWIIPIIVLVIGVNQLLMNHFEKDTIAQREPEYEAADNEVMVGFESD